MADESEEDWGRGGCKGGGGRGRGGFRGGGHRGRGAFRGNDRRGDRYQSGAVGYGDGGGHRGGDHRGENYRGGRVNRGGRENRGGRDNRGGKDHISRSDPRDGGGNRGVTFDQRYQDLSRNSVASGRDHTQKPEGGNWRGRRRATSETPNTDNGDGWGAQHDRDGAHGARGTGYIRDKRKYPTGAKKLQEWAAQCPDIVVLSLNSERSGFKELLCDPDISVEKMFLLMEVMSVAVKSESSREGLLAIYQMVFCENFINKLVAFQIGLLNTNNAKVNEFLKNQLLVCSAYCKALPYNACDQIPPLVQSVKLVLPGLKDKHSNMEGLDLEYDALMKNFEDYLIKKAELEEKKKKTTFSDRLATLDSIDPDEDYRTIPIEPSLHDINMEGLPILRRNIVDGKYKDVDTYLDVQFRLLREDFIRPLREGIRAFKKNENAKNKDVRVYRNVTILGSEIIRSKLVYSIKVNLPKRVNLATSKRLMYGNMVCLSNDKFKTFLLAAVSHKEEAKLCKGIVGISFFEEIKIDWSTKYTIVESSTFFVAYKHVLLALQRLDQNTLPLTEHIVHVEKHVEPPVYVLNTRPYYDLRVVLNETWIKQSKANVLFPQCHTVVPPEDGHYRLRNLPIGRDLATWPLCDQFGLDQSQLLALHAALNKRLVIIQGPPGTGKTFLGLKVTQVLLHNSDAWMDGPDTPRPPELEAPAPSEKDWQPPILVVCYTNHALDQFLEGMQKFTKKIVRIGGRSKSEDMQQYQINKMVSQLRHEKRLPPCLHHANMELEGEMRDAEGAYRSLQKRLETIDDTQGLLNLKVLKAYGIIPTNVVQQLHNDETVYKDWLLLDDHTKRRTIDPKAVWQDVAHVPQETKPVVDDHVDDHEDEDKFYDALDLLREEEKERIDDDLDEFLSANFSVSNADSTDFQIKLSDYDSHMQQLNHDLVQQKLPIREYESKQQRLAYEKVALEKMLSFIKDKDVSKLKLHDNVNIHYLAARDKFLLYQVWKQALKAKIQEELHPYEIKFRKFSRRVDEVKRSRYLYVARQAHVVGMTTTGAAEYQAMIQDLKPKIVIIEEAAEILEAHVLATLSSSCEHLIMIGDHQQLKPSTAVYELAKQYGLETSMFERMIRNKLAYQTLEYQHRMRPEISSLLVPSIYQTLRDHASVHGRPPIMGMASNVFFLSHTHQELEEKDDNMSHSNPHEAALIMQLARHLVLQGYSTEQITVLTAYSGQFFLLKQEQRKFHNTCSGLRISIVDNFQGEENDIILLSLVRSNDKGNVGFLKIENRVCVALSRAKHGLYITGNLDQLCQSTPLWQKIRASLEENDNVGEALTLRCQNHPEQENHVKTAQDIKEKSPEGGCRKPCSSLIPLCGHTCPRICHTDDPNHVEAKCRLPCDKTCGKRHHPCTSLCYEVCPPCEVSVVKMLECGHEHSMPCHVNRLTFLCPSQVEKQIPDCKHKAVMSCHEDPAEVKCPVQCDIRLECGHSCKEKCHVKVDPEHKKNLCRSDCALLNRNCTRDHKCRLRCYEKCIDCAFMVKKRANCGHIADVSCSNDMTTYVCKEKCRKVISDCGHHCKKKCHEKCGDCKEKVMKTIAECGHRVKVECRTIPQRSACTSQQCSRLLSCGHPCTAACSQPCTTRCVVKRPTAIRCPKQHQVHAPCHLADNITEETGQKYCSEPCSSNLECGHPCVGTCGGCLFGRFHQPCGQKCERVLICGHVCKSPCSSACPPCQEKCRWRCRHSRCVEKCGTRCTPCNEPCVPSCKHQEACGKKCGEQCPCKPCLLPCPLKLKCGHPCVGLCGDPCPPLCRECHGEELTEILFGEESEPDARFVLLTDCGHVIEHGGLDGWLNQQADPHGSNQDTLVQMKRCPRCQQPVFNNVRHKQTILRTYTDVQQVLFKHNEQTPALADISKKLLEPVTGHDPSLYEVDPSLLFLEIIKTSPLLRAVNEWIAFSRPEVAQQPFLECAPKKKLLKKWLPTLSSEQLHLYNFQADVLRQAVAIRKALHKPSLRDHLDSLLERVMSQKLQMVQQVMEESQSELQRVSYRDVVENLQLQSHNPEVRFRLAKMDHYMDPSKRFSKDRELAVQDLLKECEKYVGALGITDKERKEILMAMTGVRKGAWFKCPNNHIYCIDACGGAMEEATCPECGSKIGGMSHRLRDDNAHAPEMDGASRTAWPQ